MSGQRVSVVLLVVFLFFGGVLVFLKSRGSDGSAGNQPAIAADAGTAAATATAAAIPPGARVTLPFVYSSEKEDWLKEAVADFEKVHPDVDVQLVSKGSLDAVRALLAGEVKPVLWSPADSLAVSLLTTQWKMAKGADPLVRDGTRWPRSMLLTPLVFVAWESRAKVLLAKSTELTWMRMRDAVASKKGWSALGGETGWAYVKFGHTDPTKSNSGLQALALMAYGFYGKQDGLTVPDATAAPFQDFVKAIEAGRHAQDFAASSTGPFMENFIRQGPSLYDVVLVYEATAIAEMPRAVGRWEPLRVFYPSINIWSDHPACLMAGDWVTAAQKTSAEQLVDFLMTPAVQQRALRNGFRPGNLDVPVITQDSDNPFHRYADTGVHVDVPRIAAPPDGAVLEALLQTFQRNAPN
ncbi:MAG TPA: substrate-binding domain-containing protein [Polyangiaceae bacterium]|jgi:ABC-type glycerol-3-phosphate transport system substrate-binding protein|nr:substrate-binding domain-containing protein [Polyangiaceae bacterium]